MWAAGPATIFFLLLVINGSMRAYGRAYHELQGHFGWGNDEALDVAPNAIDLAVYTGQNSPDWIKRMLALSYPALLGVSWVEAAWMWIAMTRSRALVPGAWIFIVIGALTGLPALFQLVPLFYIKLMGPMRGANAVARA